MKKYNQYYTERKVGRRLVTALDCLIQKADCVELSAGKGALIEPLVSTGKIGRLVTCEIDPDNWKALNEKYNSAINILVDVVTPEFEKIAKEYDCFFDLAVCNPPFDWIDNNSYLKSLLIDYGFKSFALHKRIRLEVIFIIQNIRLLKPGGIMAIILPELILSSERFLNFRQLLKCHGVTITKISNNSGEFRGTEARTGIYLFKKFESSFNCDSGKKLKNIEKVEESKRHLHNDSLPTVEIKRGTWTGKQCRNSSIKTFHTSDFCNLYDGSLDLVEKNSISSISNHSCGAIAEGGDCVIARVGSRVLGKVGYIKSGKYLVSDCIFVVKLGNLLVAKKFCEYWQENADAWLSKYSKGTCAKYIIKKDVADRAVEILEKINKEELSLSVASL